MHKFLKVELAQHKAEQTKLTAKPVITATATPTPEPVAQETNVETNTLQDSLIVNSEVNVESTVPFSTDLVVAIDKSLTALDQELGICDAGQSTNPNFILPALPAPTDLLQLVPYGHVATNATYVEIENSYSNVDSFLYKSNEANLWNATFNFTPVYQLECLGMSCIAKLVDFVTGF
jgi:hypothetical protein